MIAGLPYTMELVRPRLAGRGLSIGKVAFLQSLQTTVLLALSIGFGLLASLRTGLNSGAFAHWPESCCPQMSYQFGRALIAGFLSGAVVVAVDYLVFLSRLPALRQASAHVVKMALWKKLGASLYGGVAEELIMRLGLFSLTLWALKALASRTAASSDSALLWTTNLIVALLFGAGHLPATAALVPLNRLLVLRALLINGIPSIAFGYLYFTFGLEAAMLGHLVTDLTIQFAGSVVSADVSSD